MKEKIPRESRFGVQDAFYVFALAQRAREKGALGHAVHRARARNEVEDNFYSLANRQRELAVIIEKNRRLGENTNSIFFFFCHGH